MIILKVTIKQGFILQAFSVNNLSFDKLITWRDGYKQRKLVKKKSTES